MGKQIKNSAGSKALTLTAWLIALVALFPFFMMVLISFRVSGDAYEPFYYIIKPTMENYKTVFLHKNYLDWYSNTIVTVVITILLRLLVTLPASYSFSRLKFKGRGFILGLLLATMMVPGETTMVPRYLYFKTLHLLDTKWSIILPEITEVFYLMLMTEFFRSIPEDFSEAARIDGCSHPRILSSIFLPLSGPSIATTVLFSFINIWNNFLDPYLFINSIDKQMITPALKFFQERGGANIPVQLAGASLAIIPILILFTVTQKYFVAGVSSSGIKG